MKTLPISRYRFFQKLQPVNLLTKMANKCFTGCLQVFSEFGTWSIYMDKGKVIYAGYSEKMFEPLYRNLQILSKRVATIPQGINDKLRIIFEKNRENSSIANPEYLAICWLVKERYISDLQSAILIEQLAIETLQSLLKLEYGSYEFIPDTFLDNLPKFCHLDLTSLLDYCSYGAKFNPEERYNSQYNIYDRYYDSDEGKKEPVETFQEKLPSVDQVELDYKDDQSQSQFQLFSYQSNYQKSDKKKYCVFCVDENLQMLNNIQDFLDEQIFAVVKFTNSSQALMEILNVKPDMILLNIAMRNLDGYEVCSLLRKNPNYQDIPVILMTERMGLRNRAKAKIVKANSYLETPFTQEDLLKKVFEHIV